MVPASGFGMYDGKRVDYELVSTSVDITDPPTARPREHDSNQAR
jgi:hypothetical protein